MLYYMAMRALIISAIVLVAVIMGLSTAAPVIPYVDASDGNTDLPDYLCDYLRNMPNPSPQLIQTIVEHCSAQG